MEVGFQLQIYQASSSWLLGLSIGLYYDLLKTVRRRIGGRGVTLLFDLLFWLTVALALFVQTITVGQGGFRIFMVVTNALGALLYFWVLSGPISALLRNGLDKLLKFIYFITAPVRKIWEKGKNIAKKYKKDFKNRVKQCIMVYDSIDIRRTMRKKRKGGGLVEEQKGKHFYETSDTGTGRLRGVQPDRPSRADRTRQRGRDGLGRDRGRTGSGKRGSGE